jgi:hypothetical protein
MRSPKRTLHRIFIALVIAVAATFLALGVHLAVERNKARQRLVRLLGESDYQVLLEACRQLSLPATAGELSFGTYWVRVDRQPRLLQVPEAILAVEPLYIRIDPEGDVLLEMGGIPYYGIVAYPGISKEDYGFRGNAELVPGLWYYDEDYRDEHPRHKARVDVLIRQGRRGSF